MTENSSARRINPPFVAQTFTSFQEWVTKASSWLTGHPDYNNTEHGETKGWRGKHFTALCFDSLGRRCRCGADMQRARDEGAFPVWWIWPDQIVEALTRRVPVVPASDHETLLSDALALFRRYQSEHVAKADRFTANAEAIPAGQSWAKAETNRVIAERIEAFLTTPAQPSTVTVEGWKLVPTEPTEAMLDAVNTGFCADATKWRRALDLAPVPPQSNIVRAALSAADEISNRIHAGGYRASLSDVEELRNHVRKLAKVAANPAPSPVTGALVDDELTEDAIRSKARALLKHMGWRAKDRPGWHSIIELMTRFGLECRKVTERCAYPECGCDRDAVCAVAVERIDAALAAQKAEG